MEIIVFVNIACALILGLATNFMSVDLYSSVSNPSPWIFWCWMIYAVLANTLFIVQKGKNSGIVKILLITQVLSTGFFACMVIGPWNMILYFFN